MKEQLTAPDYKYDTGLRDQNAIVYLLKKNWPEMRTRLQLVNKQYCLNCYWRDLMAIGDIASSEKRVSRPFGVCEFGQRFYPLEASCFGVSPLFPLLYQGRDSTISVERDSFALQGADLTLKRKYMFCLNSSLFGGLEGVCLPRDDRYDPFHSHLLPECREAAWISTHFLHVNG